MKPSSFVLLLMLAALMGVGCQSSWTTTTSRPVTPPMPVAHDHQTMEMDTPSETKVMNLAGIAKLATVGDVLFTPEVYSPGTFTMAFKINGENGKAYRPEDLNVVHDRLIHVILVRKDMKVYRHEHPEFQKNGYWSFKTTITEPGEYWAYLDISPKVDPAVVWRVQFAVRGKWENQAPLLTPDLKVTVDGIQASLRANKLKVGKEATLDIAVTKDGKAVSDLQPYLAAYGHLVALRYKSPEIYLHTHPLTTTQPKDGHVKFAVTFPAAGMYTLFAQFNVNGTVKAFPITMQVDD